MKTNQQFHFRPKKVPMVERKAEMSDRIARQTAEFLKTRVVDEEGNEGDFHQIESIGMGVTGIEYTSPAQKQKIWQQEQARKASRTWSKIGK